MARKNEEWGRMIGILIEESVNIRLFGVVINRGNKLRNGDGR